MQYISEVRAREKKTHNTALLALTLALSIGTIIVLGSTMCYTWKGCSYRLSHETISWMALVLPR